MRSNARKTCIVRGELILDTGVAETYNQFHAARPFDFN